MFLIFVKACKKYRFTYAISSYSANNELTLILRPINTFENIKIEEKLCGLESYCRVFIRAIKKMKKYRKERGY
mgnify:CR=1 FL=1